MLGHLKRCHRYQVHLGDSFEQWNEKVPQGMVSKTSAGRGPNSAEYSKAWNFPFSENLNDVPWIESSKVSTGANLVICSCTVLDRPYGKAAVPSGNYVEMTVNIQSCIFVLHQVLTKDFSNLHQGDFVKRNIWHDQSNCVIQYSTVHLGRHHCRIDECRAVHGCLDLWESLTRLWGNLGLAKSLFVKAPGHIHCIIGFFIYSAA